MNGWTLRCGLIGAGLIAALESSAMAQNDSTATSATVEDGARKERAKGLRDRADEDMKTGNHATACALYAESNDLVPDLQTEADLIECQVKLGLYADAHQRMLEAAEKAKAIPDKDAWEWALKRAQEIKEEAPCIVVDVSEELRAIPDLEVSLDGATIPRASWNDLCVPVNLGTHQIQARAARRTWNPQRTTALVPRKHYLEALARPVVVIPEPPPQEKVNPVKPFVFIIPSAIFGVIGLLPLLVMEHNTTDRTREVVAASFLGAAVGGFTSGLTVYATTSPVPQNGAKLTAGEVGVIYRGRF